MSAACELLPSAESFWLPVQSFIKFDVFGPFFGICSLAGTDKRVLYRERNSQVWNRIEQGDIRLGSFRDDRAGSEGGLAGARARRRSCHPNGSEFGLCMTVGDEVLHGHDHREGLDLAGDAASGRFRAKVGYFPEAIQYIFAIQFQAVLFPGILLDELLLDSGAVLDHVGADMGCGFDVGG